jgi:protein-tyrosine phosphatase
MAEFIMKDLVRNAGREKEFEIASAATSTEEIWNGVGNPVYPPAKRKLAEHGICCEGKRARQITAADGEYYDFLICMDSANVRNTKRVCGHEEKVHLLLEYAGINRDVADPWYTDDLEATWRDVLQGCKALLKTL